VVIALYFDLSLFDPTQIAQENHEALLAQDEADDTKQKKERSRCSAHSSETCSGLSPLWQKVELGKAEVCCRIACGVMYYLHH
jgi:hypothetical protein